MREAEPQLRDTEKRLRDAEKPLRRPERQLRDAEIALHEGNSAFRGIWRNPETRIACPKAHSEDTQRLPTR